MLNLPTCRHAPCLADVLRTMHVLITRGGVMDMVVAAARQQALLGQAHASLSSGPPATHMQEVGWQQIKYLGQRKPQPDASHAVVERQQRNERLQVPCPQLVDFRYHSAVPSGSKTNIPFALPFVPVAGG